MIQERMLYYDLPESLQERILQYMDSMWERHRISDGQSMESFTEKLSEPLQLEVGLWLNRNMVLNVPLFKNCDASVIIFLIKSLKSHLYLPGDYVVRYGELGDDMYFLRKGACAILVPKDGDDARGPAGKKSRRPSGKAKPTISSTPVAIDAGVLVTPTGLAGTGTTLNLSDVSPTKVQVQPETLASKQGLPLQLPPQRRESSLPIEDFDGGDDMKREALIAKRGAARRRQHLADRERL